MLKGPDGIEELLSRLRSITSTSDRGEARGENATVNLDPHDLERLLAFVEKAMVAAEKAQALLANAYSMPDDEHGARFLSEDAVKLQWALREIGIGDDSGQPCFTD